MNKTFVIFMNTVLRLAMIVGAIFMALNEIKGYGWLIAGAILCGLSIKTSNGDDIRE